jgi:membrane protease YdiL (CAAX protease family)
LWGEEFGWRGYLQIRLLADRPLAAAVVTGLIWGAWHYPIILAGYERYESPPLGLLIFPVLTVLLSIIFGWLRLRTGSVWSASLAHASTNAVGGSLTALLFLGGSSMTLVGYNGVLAWVPLGAVCLWIIFSGQLKP